MFAHGMTSDELWRRVFPEGADPGRHIILHDREVVVNGIRIYGFPWTRSNPSDPAAGFADNDQMDQMISRIPIEIDVLVTNLPAINVRSTFSSVEFAGSIISGPQWGSDGSNHSRDFESPIKPDPALSRRIEDLVGWQNRRILMHLFGLHMRTEGVYCNVREPKYIGIDGSMPVNSFHSIIVRMCSGTISDPLPIDARRDNRAAASLSRDVVLSKLVDIPGIDMWSNQGYERLCRQLMKFNNRDVKIGLQALSTNPNSDGTHVLDLDSENPRQPILWPCRGKNRMNQIFRVTVRGSVMRFAAAGQCRYLGVSGESVRAIEEQNGNSVSIWWQAISLGNDGQIMLRTMTHKYLTFTPHMPGAMTLAMLADAGGAVFTLKLVDEM
jgi:hypothetical protein